MPSLHMGRLIHGAVHNGIPINALMVNGEIARFFPDPPGKPGSLGMLEPLPYELSRMASGRVGSYFVFAGGQYFSGFGPIHGTVYSRHTLQQSMLDQGLARVFPASANLSTHFMVMGGRDASNTAFLNGPGTNGGTAYNSVLQAQSFTGHPSTQTAERDSVLSEGVSMDGGSKVAFFGGAQSTNSTSSQNIILWYDETLQCVNGVIGPGGSRMAATGFSAGSSAVVAAGYTSNSNITGTRSNRVDILSSTQTVSIGETIDPSRFDAIGGTLPDGSGILAGGRNNLGNAITGISYLYSPALVRSTLTPGLSMPQANRWSQVSNLGNYYMIGGLNGVLDVFNQLHQREETLVLENHGIDFSSISDGRTALYAGGRVTAGSLDTVEAFGLL